MQKPEHVRNCSGTRGVWGNSPLVYFFDVGLLFKFVNGTYFAMVSSPTETESNILQGCNVSIIGTQFGTRLDGGLTLLDALVRGGYLTSLKICTHIMDPTSHDIITAGVSGGEFCGGHGWSGWARCSPSGSLSWPQRLLRVRRWRRRCWHWRWQCWRWRWRCWRWRWRCWCW